MEVDRLGSPTSGEESSGDEDEDEDEYVTPRRQQRNLSTARAPHALEVQALFSSDDDQSEATCDVSNWSNPGSERDDEIDSELEVSATWSGPLNPAKHRMSIYY